VSAVEPAVEVAKRSDAVRNRRRVLAAAEAVFAERGVDAGVPEIAERAGVGKATVYRSFPTKEHLVAAVAVARLEDFEQRVRAQLDAPDAWQALHDLLADSAVRQCADRAITAALGSAVAQEPLASARASMWAAVSVLLERAKAEGRIASEVTAADLRVLWAGVARVLAADGNGDPAAWQRYAGLVLRALSA
jgi:AcrR family transcriptional regulator